MNTKQIRQKILDLAIRGKLVPQNPNDEPTSVLLERIRGEREQYQNVPFEVPDGWCWCRLGDVCEIITGNTPSKSNKTYYGVEYPFYKPTDLDAGYNVFMADDMLSKKGFDISRKLPVNTVLVTCIGATIGKTGIIRTAGCSNQQINAIIPKIDLLPDYIYFVCISNFFQNMIHENASATTLPIINKGNFEKLLFLFPPLSEQRRIVSAIESMFAVIDEIERNEADLLSAVTAAKSKILSLAIRGKLVEQDPNDEPASVLLERIRAEREQLIKEGKIRRGKNENNITASDKSHYEDLPFEVPDGWCWSTINEISESVSAGGDRPDVFSPVKSKDCPIPIFSNGITDNGLYGFTNIATIKSPSVTISARGTIGFSHIRYEPFCPIVRLITVTPNTLVVLLEYLQNALCYLIPRGEGSSIPQLTVPSIKPKLLPIPPLAEQRRIVSAIESVFERLDEILSALN